MKEREGERKVAVDKIESKYLTHSFHQIYLLLGHMLNIEFLYLSMASRPAKNFEVENKGC